MLKRIVIFLLIITILINVFPYGVFAEEIQSEEPIIPIIQNSGDTGTIIVKHIDKDTKEALEEETLIYTLGTWTVYANEYVKEYDDEIQYYVLAELDRKKEVTISNNGQAIELEFLYKKKCPSGGRVIYVKENGGGNGSSWDSPMGNLQMAIEMARPGDQIWIAEGRYTPKGYRIEDRYFQMKNCVAIYGGFPANSKGKGSLEDRDWTNYKTILSGDESYHVFYHFDLGLDHTAILDGVTITGGFADSSTNHDYEGEYDYDKTWRHCFGGGMYNYNSSPWLRNVVITNNTSTYRGAGMYNKYSNPRLDNVSITNNNNRWDEFTGNGGGGGMYSSESSPILTNVSITGNFSGGNGGGGIYHEGGSLSLTNVTISGNNSKVNGGGINHESGDITLHNSVIWGNNAKESGNNVYTMDSTKINVAYSLIEGSGGSGQWNSGFGIDQGNNIDEDPLFRDYQDSPLIEAGSNELNIRVPEEVVNPKTGKVVPIDPALIFNIPTDIRGKKRIVNDVIDIGACENQPALSIQSNLDPVNNRANVRSVLTGADMEDVVMKYAKGSYDETNFPHNQSTLINKKGEFFVPENGMYSIYLESTSGFHTVDKVFIQYDFDDDNDDNDDNDEIIGNIIYVKEDGSGDGSSWEQALGDLHTAIEEAQPGDQVWIAAGTYVPTGHQTRNNPKTQHFEMKNGVTIYGGFPANASNNTGMEDRDWEEHKTILSGNLGGEHVYNVFYTNNSIWDSTAILDGVTITGGHGSLNGGGMNIYESSPVIRNTIFTDNSAAEGGSLYIVGAPLLENVTVTRSTARYGGGIYIKDTDYGENGDVILNGVSIMDNIASERGGGIHLWDYVEATIKNSTISGNRAIDGGGIYYDESYYDDGFLDIINTEITGNVANSSGGGIHNYKGKIMTLTNVTLSGNTANIGGGLFNYVTEVIVNNSIIWGNNASTEGENISLKLNPNLSPQKQFLSYPHYSNSLVEGAGGSGRYWNTNFGYDGGKNIDVNPQFYDFRPADGKPESGGNYTVHQSSPVVDTGSNYLYFERYRNTFKDLANEKRIVNTYIDIGAYEYIPKVEISWDKESKDKEVVINVQPINFTPTIMKWAFGQYNERNFPEGNLIENGEFLVRENGIYTVYFENAEGFKNTQQISFNWFGYEKPVEVISVEPIADMEVAYGTEESALSLPTTVQVTLSDQTSTSLRVTWDDGTPEYDGNTAGEYIFTGTFEDDVINPQKLKAEVKVVVKLKQVEPDTATIIVNNIDIDTKEVLDTETLIKELGTHTVNPKEIEGYTLADETSKEVILTTKGEEVTVKFEYKKNSVDPDDPDDPDTATIVVNHIDIDTNDVLETETLTKELGTHAVNPKEIEGYTLADKASKEVTLTTKDEEVIVEFGYKKDPVEPGDPDEPDNPVVPDKPNKEDPVIPDRDIRDRRNEKKEIEKKEESIIISERKSVKNGKTILDVKVNNKLIESIVKNSNKGNKNIILFPISDKASDIMRLYLTGDIVKRLEDKSFIISIDRGNIQYNISSNEFKIEELLQELGLKESELKNIQIEIQIEKINDELTRKYKEIVNKNGSKLLVQPVDFNIKAIYTNKDGIIEEKGINKFSRYVERIIEITEDIEPSKTITGIVFDSNGLYSHIPTVIFNKGGKWYAKLNSLTNSAYSVISNRVTVKSVENHWSKIAVEDMAARLIIANPENFDPKGQITRGEFAEYIVKALGIYKTGVAVENQFTDVNPIDPLADAIKIAVDYGIVKGYNDGTFKPNSNITRQEAMVMFEKAMKIAGLEVIEDNRIDSYTDKEQVSDWAYTDVKKVLSAGIFNGTSHTTISPMDTFSYSETATAIRNLLIKLGLINN